MTNARTLVEARSVVVCCGTGGVGKTTVSAALGVLGATLGKKVCVVTVDPARRLSDALGIATTTAPVRVDGPWSGTLFAAMLDARATFDELVRRHSADARQAERITRNAIYENLVTTLSGTQEYMATELLYELHASRAYDLIVIDTPPAHQAIEFLDAAPRLARFLSNRVVRALIEPAHLSARAAGLAARLATRSIAKVAGATIVDDAVAFFQAFTGMESGFARRAATVSELLASDDCAFALVVEATRACVGDAVTFATRLARLGHGIELVVANRVLPSFDVGLELPDAPGTDWAKLVANYDELSSAARAQRAAIGELRDALLGVPVGVLPLVQEADQLAALTALASELNS